MAENSKAKKPLRERVGEPYGVAKPGEKVSTMTVEVLENLDKYYKVAGGRKGAVLTLRTKLAKVLIEDKKAKLVRSE